jgi:PAS domain S-box-containing protein
MAKAHHFSDLTDFPDSLSALYQAPHLGVLIARGPRIVEANDAFLRMVGRPRQSLGDLRWTDLTPPEYFPVANRALQELIETGACTPFEKEYLLPDGSRVAVLVGASRIEENPLTWVSYIVELSALRKRTEKAHQLQIQNAARSAEVPLTVVQNWVKLLESQADDIEVSSKNFLPTIQQALESVQSKLQTISRK